MKRPEKGFGKKVASCKARGKFSKDTKVCLQHELEFLAPILLVFNLPHFWHFITKCSVN